MAKKRLCWLIAAVIIMILLPWLAVTFIKGDAGMAVCLILFFAVNPVFSVLIGVFAGKDADKNWYLPVISPLLFIAGTWMFFDIGETAFVADAGFYLMLGLAAMFLSKGRSNKLS